MPRSKPDPDDTQAPQQASLRGAGLKVTGPRLKVLDVLRAGPARHYSADDVYRQLLQAGADVGLATVYRVLSQLELAGIVVRSTLQGERAVFELNEGSHHDHLVCIRCGRVDEFTDATIEARQQAVARRHGYLLTDHRLALFGLCASCAASDPR